MNDLPKDLNELAPYDMDAAIIEQTAQQLIKDFAEFSITIEFKGMASTPYQELFNQVLPYIELMLRNNSSMFTALLYRIDVNEKDIKRANLDYPGIPFPELVTDLILRRELKKVLTKRYFSK